MTEIEQTVDKILTTAETLKKLCLVQDAMLKHLEGVMPGTFAVLAFNEDWMKLKMQVDMLKYKLENEH